jgi:hypothetical protein
MESTDNYQQDADLFDRWLQKWTPSAILVKQSEYTWQVEAPLVALTELPRRMFLLSDWATYPALPAGGVHDAWRDHFDDGESFSVPHGRPAT